MATVGVIFSVGVESAVSPNEQALSSTNAYTLHSLLIVTVGGTRHCTKCPCDTSSSLAYGVVRHETLIELSQI